MSLNSVDLIKSSLVFSKDNLLPLGALGVMFMAPYAFASERVTTGIVYDGFTLMTIVWYAAMFIFSIVGSFLLQACVVTAYFERDESGRVRIDRAVPRALKRLGPMLITALLVGLAVMAGYICFIIPGIILIFGLSAAIPMAIAEDVEPMDALKGSWELTKGHKLDIFVTLLLFGLFLIPVMIVMVIITGIIGAVLGFVLPNSMVQVLTMTLLMGVVNLPGQVLFAKIYETLRGMAASPQMMDHAPGYAPPQQHYAQAPGAPPAAAPPMGAPPAGPPAQ